MPTSGLGSKKNTAWMQGFTLVELLIVLLVAALASSMVMWSMAQQNERHLQSEAVRLIANLESSKALARSSERVLTLGLDAQGFYVQGLPEDPLKAWHYDWLYAQTQATLTPNPISLGPEALMAQASIDLFDSNNTQHHVYITSDGLQPFHIQLP
jgi:type II secretion system protein H